MDTEVQTAERRMSQNHVDVVAEIVSAYVSNNAVPPHELPGLIASVHASVSDIEHGQTEPESFPARVPAVSIGKSLGDDYLISLIDGKQYRTLRRHLGTHGMTPESYREEFGLPAAYPMVAPAYSASRSKLAKEIGLGFKQNRGAKLVRKDAKPRGRPRKDAA